MFDLPGESDSILADTAYTIRTDCNSMRYISASAGSPGAGDSSSSTASSSISRPTGRPAHIHNKITRFTYWTELSSTSHGGNGGYRILKDSVARVGGLGLTVGSGSGSVVRKAVAGIAGGVGGMGSVRRRESENEGDGRGERRGV